MWVYYIYYNVFIHLNHVHVLLMFLFICTEINQFKSNQLSVMQLNNDYLMNTMQI